MMQHPNLTEALARAATRLVAENRVGSRRGSVAAVARAMADFGVAISKSQLGRKLDGKYPFDTDELEALAAVLGIPPDHIWRDALALQNPQTPPEAGWESMADTLLGSLPPQALEEIARVAGFVRPPPRGSEKRTAEEPA